MNNFAKEVLKTIGLIIGTCFVTLLFTSNVACGVHVSGHSMKPTLQDADYLIMERISNEFDRFDVVVFDAEEMNGTLLIKRIVGLPGETVQITKDGVLLINGEPTEIPYSAEQIFPFNIGRASEPITLGEGEYFCMGDNVNNSNDSRFEQVGNVKDSEILGRVLFRLMPTVKGVE